MSCKKTARIFRKILPLPRPVIHIPSFFRALGLGIFTGCNSSFHSHLPFSESGNKVYSSATNCCRLCLFKKEHLPISLIPQHGLYRVESRQEQHQGKCSVLKCSFRANKKENKRCQQIRESDPQILERLAPFAMERRALCFVRFVFVGIGGGQIGRAHV